MFLSACTKHPLNLSFNNFNHSEIPVGVRRLSKLTRLDLFHSGFLGKIPSEILQLSKLVSLVLYSNPLKLHKPGLRSIAEKLTNLEELILAEVDISFIVPSILANLSSLTTISLRNCGLHGEFPTGILQLPNLKFLSVCFNPKLTGRVPEFNRSSPLEDLRLAGTSFSGKLPDSIGNLKSLYYLDVEFTNLTKLTHLDLSSNNFNIIVKFDLFRELNSLSFLNLSMNNLSLLIDPSINTVLQNFRVLRLGSCHLGDFPDFLQNQGQLEVLSLSMNNILGQIPKWITNLSKYTLEILDLSENCLTGFDQTSYALPWTNLQILDLRYNNIQGSLPIPPPSIVVYQVTSNMLSGVILEMICDLSSLSFLDLQCKNLSGFLPQYLKDLRNLSTLNLRHNNFHGSIGQIFMKGSKLRMISLSQNHFHGPIPRSLVNCVMLEILDLGNNHINDVFPPWISILLELRVLILQSNGFHDIIEKPKTNFGFPKLRVTNLSNNNFIGKLPLEYFQIWKGIESFGVDRATHMQGEIYINNG